MRTLRQTMARHRSQVQVCLHRYGGERSGRGMFVLRLDFATDGRLAGQSLHESNRTLQNELRTCILRPFVRAIRRQRFQGLRRATIPIRYVRDSPSPTAAERGQVALQEAHTARALGRCYLDAGNRLRAAARAVRRAVRQDGDVERALERVERARYGLSQCSLGLAGTPAQIESECVGCL